MPRSTWFSDDPRKTYSALKGDLAVDVAIVGGGITGATTAYLLKQAGLQVALCDRRQCGDAETGHTTAHLTCVTDKRLHALVDQFGGDVARATWDAGAVAVEQIAEIVEQEQIECDFVRVPGFLHAAWDDKEGRDRAGLERDAGYAVDYQYSATTIDYVPLANRFGIRFANQAMFHPLKYLAGLLERIEGDGSHVFENTEVDDIDDACTLKCAAGNVSCRRVIVATHVPLQGKAKSLSAGLLQSRLAAYSTYAVAARLPAGTGPAGLYWDTSDPYYYLRIEDRGDFQTAIFGGEDHKTGQCSDTSQPYRSLVERLHTIFPAAVVTDRWSGQVLETNDGLPLIGEIAENQYTATGFAGNGFTFGTCAAMLFRDILLDRSNPWRELFDPGRVHLYGGTWRYLRENADYLRYFARDRLVPTQGDSLADVPSGAGRIVQLHGERVAAYRDPSGEVTCLSPICPHMGCLVHWNRAERTWDCPCHGSRFGTDGKVLAGPAEAPLQEHHGATSQS